MVSPHRESDELRLNELSMVSHITPLLLASNLNSHSIILQSQGPCPLHTPELPLLGVLQQRVIPSPTGPPGASLKGDVRSPILSRPEEP